MYTMVFQVVYMMYTSSKQYSKPFVKYSFIYNFIGMLHSCLYEVQQLC